MPGSHCTTKSSKGIGTASVPCDSTTSGVWCCGCRRTKPASSLSSCPSAITTDLTKHACMNTAAEIFPPGEFLKDELEARGWSQTELAEIICRPTRRINAIIGGKRTITPETAIQLGDSLGTGPELWMNLESQYQLSQVDRKSTRLNSSH